MSSEPPHRESKCPSCGSIRDYNFCPQCGERVVHPSDFRLSSILEAFLGGLFNLEGKFWKTSAQLITRPGKQATDFVHGRRTPYWRLVSLFLFANLAYFFLQPLTGFNTLATDFYSHLNQQLHSDLATDLVDRHFEQSAISSEVFQENFDRIGGPLARALVLLLVPMFAFLFAVIQIGTKRRLAAEHVLLAVSFLSFLLIFVHLGFFSLIVHAILPLAKALGISLSNSNLEMVSVVGSTLMPWIWLYFAFQRFYGNSRRSALIRSFLVANLVLPPIYLYRLILFLVTFWLAQ